MGRARASIEVPGLASAAEELWYDPQRWASWVDGFGHVARLSEDWPAAGALTWDSLPGGRGRVLETVVAYEPRGGQTLAVEDKRLRGTQRVTFTPRSESVEVALALDYELKQRTAFTPLIDRVFIARAVAASLRRTLVRFERERRADMEMAAETSR